MRHDVAMTGELTLRGKVLPIGGLKEKLLAAARVGITTVIIPAANAPELSEIPPHVTDKLTVRPVRTMRRGAGDRARAPAHHPGDQEDDRHSRRRDDQGRARARAAQGHAPFRNGLSVFTSRT